MPNTPVRAAAEGLPNITRRLFLRNAAAASASVAAVGAATAAETSASMTALERYDYHREEMKKAAMEADPRIRFITDKDYLGMDGTSPLSVIIMGQWVTGRYDGDGIYAGGTSYGRGNRYRVKRLSKTIDDEVAYSVIPIGETRRSKWMQLSESRFETFIGPKVKGGAA